MRLSRSCGHNGRPVCFLCACRWVAASLLALPPLSIRSRQHALLSPLCTSALPSSFGAFTPQAIFEALDTVRHRDWYTACSTEVFLYRGAWQVRGWASDSRG